MLTVHEWGGNEEENADRQTLSYSAAGGTIVIFVVEFVNM